VAAKKALRILTQHLDSLRLAGVTHMPRVKSAAKTASASVKVSPADTKVPKTPPAPTVKTNPAPSLPPAPGDEHQQRLAILERLAQKVRRCRLCEELATQRTQTVFGVGNPMPRLVFLGEAPGFDEDQQGEPFVGQAGQLLNKIIEACGMQREEVYILNILKCRPPGNRVPTPTEASNCRPFLDAQLKVLQPQFICCLGATAATNLLGMNVPIGRLRGRIYDYQGAKVVCTYHPAYLLRNPAAKADTWADMKLLLKEMGLKPPKG